MDQCSAISFKWSRRELFIDVAEHRSTLKNYQNTPYPRFSFISKTVISFPKKGVCFYWEVSKVGRNRAKVHYRPIRVQSPPTIQEALSPMHHCSVDDLPCAAIILTLVCFFLSGDITQKGYEKKRSRLLAPYAPKQSHGEFFF